MMKSVSASLTILLFCLAMLPLRSGAQDVLMAKGNAQFTLSLNPTNFNGKVMKRDMKEISGLYSRFDYTVKFSKPISFTAEYAVSNYTSLGLNFNYFRYNLAEQREDAFGTQSATTKGSHLDVHVRALRYFIANTRGAFYVFGELGMQSRDIEYTGGLKVVAHINTFPETRRNNYNAFSYDYGIGFKARFYNQFGAVAEFSMLAPYGRYGLFYILQPAGRRSKDQIGW